MKNAMSVHLSPVFCWFGPDMDGPSHLAPVPLPWPRPLPGYRVPVDAMVFLPVFVDWLDVIRSFDQGKGKIYSNVKVLFFG